MYFLEKTKVWDQEMFGKSILSPNLILCLFKGLQCCLIKILQKPKILACRTRNKIHYAVYTFFTVIACNSWFDVCQHLPVGFHHLIVSAQPIVKLHSLLESFESPTVNKTNFQTCPMSHALTTKKNKGKKTLEKKRQEKSQTNKTIVLTTMKMINNKRLWNKE